VVRANYQGDVGVHVACAIWGIKKLGIRPDSADEFGRAYALGATSYKQDAEAKSEIDVINQKLYDRSDPELNALYDTGRAESLAAFEKIYALLGSKFDRYYFESETAPIGKELVLGHQELFPESDGARVFKGEDYGLHTRVFMNGKGLPTYEAKELGLETLKQREYPQARLVIVTANEVTDYFRVVKKALELIDAPLSEKLAHVPHGMMKLPTGKMSSRTGDVITGESLLHDLAEAARERARESRADDANVLAQQIAVAAIKFQVLRGATSKDIVFDREQALSLEGDSGPYLQYAFARTQAILAKASEAGVFAHAEIAPEPNIVARLLVRFPSVAERAAREYAPHHVAQYLLELAGAFNSWYAREQILDGSVHAGNKVAITAAVGNTIKHGLWLLGIPAPERM
jgi:arginyl-tRNA synthetase